jgi:HlyD family secretion protein
MPAVLRKPLTWILLALVIVVALSAANRLRGPLLETYPVQAMALTASVVATGRVQSRSRVLVASEITGTLIERPVDEGDRVQPGQLVARLDPREAQARVAEADAALAQLRGRLRPEANAAHAAATVRADQARREASRQRQLAERGLVATERVEQAEESLRLAEAEANRARAVRDAVAPGGVDEQLLSQRLASARVQLARTEIRSLVEGTVLRRLAEPGDVVQAGRGIVEIAREGAVEILAPVDERNLDRLAVGQAALVSADAFPEQRIAGELVFIAPAVDAQRGTVEVRVQVPDPPDYLRQDMTVSIDVEVGRRAQALVLPTDGLREARGDRAVVHVVRKGRVQRVAVRTGLRGLAQVEILDGLAPGERVLPASAALAPGSRARTRD